jgi:hypothetical protein
MDVDKCVALHNKIFIHGWLGSGKTIEDFDRACTTWFDHYGDEAEALQNTLSPDLLAFLGRAYVAKTDHSFFHYVSGLDHPTGLFEAAVCFNDPYSGDDPTRYIALYVMNRFACHPVGLM